MFAPTRKKRIGSVTSAERGELVTVLYTVGASEVVVPPMFVFPRVNFLNNFIVDGPLGCTAAVLKLWVAKGILVGREKLWDCTLIEIESEVKTFFF